MNTTKTDKSDKIAKRLTLTRETLRTLTMDELRLVAGGGAAPFRSCGSACAK